MNEIIKTVFPIILFWGCFGNISLFLIGIYMHKIAFEFLPTWNIILIVFIAITIVLCFFKRQK